MWPASLGGATVNKMHKRIVTALGDVRVLTQVERRIEHAVGLAALSGAPLEEVPDRVDTRRQFRIVCSVVGLVEETGFAYYPDLGFQTVRSRPVGFCRKQRLRRTHVVIHGRRPSGKAVAGRSDRSPLRRRARCGIRHSLIPHSPEADGSGPVGRRDRVFYRGCPPRATPEPVVGAGEKWRPVWGLLASRREKREERLGAVAGGPIRCARLPSPASSRSPAASSTMTEFASRVSPQTRPRPSPTAPRPIPS